MTDLGPLIAIVGLAICIMARFWIVERRRRNLIEAYKADPARRARQGG